MTERCEFKEECDACRVGGCVFIDDEERCPDCKFAILVVNRTVEKAKNVRLGTWIDDGTCGFCEEKALGLLEALKMEVK